MLDKNNADAGLAQGPDKPSQRIDLLGNQTGCRFVEQQYTRLDGQRAGDLQQSPVSVRETAGGDRHMVTQPDKLDQRLCPGDSMVFFPASTRCSCDRIP